MANVKLNFNSKNGSFDIALDGTQLDNVSDFSYYTWYQETMDGPVKMGQISFGLKEGDKKNAHYMTHSWIWQFGNEAEASYSKSSTNSKTKLMELIGRQSNEK